MAFHREGKTNGPRQKKSISINRSHLSRDREPPDVFQEPRVISFIFVEMVTALPLANSPSKPS